MRKTASDRKPSGSSPPLLSTSRGAGDPALDLEIYRLILWAGERCGMTSYAKKIWLKWNQRFTATLGRASYGKGTIELAAKVWGRVSSEERQRCVVHEACHLFAYERYVASGKRRFIQDHGEHWKKMMARCGYPDAPAQFSDPEYDRSKEFQKYVVYCRCQDHFVSPQKMGRIRKGNYRCRKCGSKIRTTPYGDEEKTKDSRAES